MTTDELLAKLDAEMDGLVQSLPKAYEDLGRVVHTKLRDTVAGVYSSDAGYEYNKINGITTRWNDILTLKQQIKREVEKKPE